LAFSFADKYGVQALGLITTMILARLLTPSEFGLFAVASAIAMLIEVFRDFGVGNFLVQEQEITPHTVRCAFTVTLVLSLLCSAALLIAASPLAMFYRQPGINRIMPLFAANFLLLPFATPGLSLMRRDLEFGRLAAINLLGAVINSIVVVALALLGTGFMSLAWAYLAGNVARTAAVFLWQPQLWAFRPSIAEWRRVGAFGGYSVAAGAINVFHDSLPQLIVGRMLGLGALGLLSRATALCQLPDRLLVRALYPVLLPALAEHVREYGDAKQPYLRALTHMTAFQWPILLCLSVLANPVVRVLLGGQWLAAAPLIRIMALASLALFPAFLTEPVLVANSRVRDTLTMSLISLPPSVAIIFGASLLGLEWVAAAQFINAPLQVYVAMIFIRRRMDLGWGEIALAVRSSLLVALCSVVAPAVAVILAGPSFDLSILSTMIAGIGAVAGWVTGLFVTQHPMLRELWSGAKFVEQRFRKRV
jgi:O-antigen/teichoic acid export membrane protein